MWASQRDTRLGLGRQNLRVRLKNRVCGVSVERCPVQPCGYEPNACTCAGCLFRVSSRLYARVCFSERECVWMGEEMTGGPGGMESPVADSTPSSFYYQITCDKQLRQSAKVRPAGKELWWGRRRSPGRGKRRNINATCVCVCVCHSRCPPYVMQSSVCHFQTCRGTAMGLASHRPPPSQQTRLRLTDSKKEVFDGNTINADWDIWSNTLLESKSTITMKTNSEQAERVV